MLFSDIMYISYKNTEVILQWNVRNNRLTEYAKDMYNLADLNLSIEQFIVLTNL